MTKLQSFLHRVLFFPKKSRSTGKSQNCRLGQEGRILDLYFWTFGCSVVVFSIAIFEPLSLSTLSPAGIWFRLIGRMFPVSNLIHRRRCVAMLCIARVWYRHWKSWGTARRNFPDTHSSVLFHSCIETNSCGPECQIFLDWVLCYFLKEKFRLIYMQSERTAQRLGTEQIC